MKYILSVIITLICIYPATGQDQITIDDNGIMRWKDSTEVTGFGVNYTVPFAYAYRNGKKMGVDLKAAIDQDVYHFARLGLDLFRVHVWDTEISDTLGNLLQNENLDLFDYLLFKLNERGIRSVITPIAYWGNGWPERDEPTPGFSYKYGKDSCLIDPNAIKAQENYLAQFVQHINPYNGRAYKDDPMILAFEISNEPHHQGTSEEVTSFVKKMKDAIRSTGTTKPIFYNVTHSIHFADAYFNAGIDGGTFQWYPTGLGFQKELGGNMLPNVDRYTIPFDDVLKKNSAARFVYEFDAADMGTSYMYPAMARSFRTAGMQLATHFSYDPTFLAPYNTEYNTHFMNLVYAPQKALSLMICAEVFRHIPLYEDYGVYPSNTTFGPFSVSYEKNLAEMLTDEKYIYTNHSDTKIKSPEKLKMIAGWGNSTLVKYDGTGAYFLDKLGEGIWRLELMPDAVVVDNLFGQNNLDTKRAVIKYERRNMKFDLPDLEDNYFIQSVDWRDSIIYREVEDGYVKLKPGIYLLMAAEYDQDNVVTLQSQKNLQLNEYCAPKSNLTETYINVKAPRTWNKHQDIYLPATIVSSVDIDSAKISFLSSMPTQSKYAYKMHRKHGFQYEGIIPQENLENGNMSFSITAQHQNIVPTTPNVKGKTSSRMSKSLGKSVSAVINIVSPSDAIALFEARYDSSRLNRRWVPGSKIINTDTTLGPALYIKLNGLARRDNENRNATPVGDYSIRHYFGDLIEGRRNELGSKKTLVFNGATPGNFSFPVQISLVMKDGTAFGGKIKLNKNQKRYTVALNDLKKVKAVLLPRPYPTFLPYFSSSGKANQLELSQMESLQISIGPGIPESDWDKVYEIMIGGISIE